MDVIATAGHVDHGKSTLVRALTGMEPDRYAEERRRGMTLDLGFVWTTLPSGRTVAFVDVPGHARFVSTMLAGVGPVPAVLFVVGADEGWQQQSEEHLLAVEALGIRHGLLAVTRADLADPAPALAEATARLAAGSLGRVEAVAVSAVTGTGMTELRAALDRLAGDLPAPDPAAPVRLWVDRAFTIRGAGTVVTGTLGAGTLHVGDELSLDGRPDAQRTVRVRGLQSLGEPQRTVGAVARVAVNLRGVDVDDVSRGCALLTPGAWLPTAELDVRVSVDPAGLPDGLRVHVGAAAVPVHVRPLGADTARLVLSTPLPLRAGDRALLRHPGGGGALAGVLVLDAAPPRLARRGAGTRRDAELAGETGVPDLGREVRRRGSATRRELAALGVPGADGPPPAGTVAAGDRLVDADRWAAWGAALTEAVRRHAQADPLDAGLPEEAARREVGVPDLATLRHLVAARGLSARGGRLRPVAAGPPPEVLAAAGRLRDRLGDSPFAAPEAAELPELGLTPALLSALARAGLVLRLPGEVLLLPEAEEQALALLRPLGRFTLSQARQALGTTRRVAVPLLEHLDRRGLTRRVDSNLREVRR